MKTFTKILSRILLVVGAIVLILLPLVLAFVEGRMLVSLDWTLYEQPVKAFFMYFGRFLASLGFIAAAIVSLITAKREDPAVLLRMMLVIAACLAAIWTLNFYESFIALPLLAGSVFLLGANALEFVWKR